MSASETLKIKIVSVFAEKKVKSVMKVRKLTTREQEKLYLKTFNELNLVIQDI